MNRYIISIFVLFIFALTSQAAELRSWVGSNGKTIEAEFVSYDKDNEIVVIKKSDGKELRVKLSLFSDKDQDYVKNGGKENTENPFDENSTVQNQLKEGEVIRVTLDISETGDCKLQLVRTSKPPQDDFKGRDIKLTLLPNTKIRVNDEGLTNFVYDFKEKIDPIFLLWSQELKGIEINEGKKLLMMTPPVSDFITSISSHYNHFPVHIIYDIVQFKKEVFNLSSVFPKETPTQCFSCRVTCQSGINSPFSISCRWGTGAEKLPKNPTWDFRDLCKLDNISLSLDKPVQCDFRLPLTTTTDRFSCRIGRNLNIGQESPDEEPIGISRIEFTGRYSPLLGIGCNKKDNDITIISIMPQGFLKNAGIETGDILYSINDIKCQSVESVYGIVGNTDMSKPLIFRIKRNGQFKDINIFEQIK